MNSRRKTKSFVVCVNNRGLAASLERGKIYRRLPDPAAEAQGMVRVVDESGDDYLFPMGRFQPIRLPEKLRDALVSKAGVN